jgi:LPS-assembly lipoprotein
MKTQYLLIVLLFTLTACGFHLRGWQQTAAVEVAKIYVSSLGANNVVREVKSQLQGAGASAVASAAEAEFTLRIERENFNQTVLSVSATTGKVEEYQITLTVTMSVVDASGKELLVGEGIRLARDFTFDEDAVLGKAAEEDVLREDLIRQTAAQILRRLNAVTSST